MRRTTSRTNRIPSFCNRADCRRIYPRTTEFGTEETLYSRCEAVLALHTELFWWGYPFEDRSRRDQRTSFEVIADLIEEWGEDNLARIGVRFEGSSIILPDYPVNFPT